MASREVEAAPLKVPRSTHREERERQAKIICVEPYSPQILKPDERLSNHLKDTQPQRQFFTSKLACMVYPTACNKMHWRPFRESDLPFCLDMQPPCLGDQLVGRNAALQVWKSLVQRPAFLATVIESEHPIAGNRITACGMGVFVRREFADCEISEPQAGLNSRVILNLARSAPDASPILDREEIGQGNARGGLDFVNLYGTWRDGVLNATELSEVKALLGTGFAEQFTGYRFNRVLKEAIGEERIALARATGTYRLIAEYPKTESALFVVTPDSALSAPYSVAASIYRYHAPVLRLRPAEQQLLTAALSGQTDAELSEELGLSIEATKKRWLSIFGRVGQYRPEILSPSEEGDRRGPQKRHRIVAYVRKHPEELRPYAWG